MVAKLHRVHFPGVGEGIVHKPGGCPFTYDDEEVYPIGSYVRFGNKGFVYAGVGSGTIANLQYGAKQASILQPVGWSTIAATVAAGVKQVTVDLGATSGPAGDGNLAKDYLKGGEICLMPTWGTGFTRHITGNSVVTGDSGGEFTVDFDSPTPAAMTVDVAHAECIPSPYKDVQALTTGSSKNPVVGMATVIAADGKFEWLQVEGPFGIAAQNDVGHAGHDLQAVFRHDGTIGPHADGDGNEAEQQHAGVIMFMSLASGQGTPFINLQIAH